MNNYYIVIYISENHYNIVIYYNYLYMKIILAHVNDEMNS